LATSKAARAWLAKASRDLRTAKALMSARPAFLDAAAFFCQQSTEKSLKAYLLANGQRIKKIHDLVTLHAEAMSVGFGVELSARRLATLSKYAIEFRYPGGSLKKLNRKTLLSALTFARDINTHVASKIQ
jgi:HEPN domain-containing protein